MSNDTIGRRTALKTMGAASVGLLGTGALSRRASGGNMTWSQNAVTDLPDGFKYHLGSGLENVSTNNKQYRVAGDYCILKNGKLPIEEGPPRGGPSPHTQTVWIVNESPDALSVFTSSESDEIAMHPKPNNHDDGSSSGAFSVVTGAASVAATAAKATTVGKALTAVSLVKGMYALFFDGNGGSDHIYKWQGNYGAYGMPRGGHHVDFVVNKSGSGNGTIKVSSTIHPGPDNEWRLSFTNGNLSAVNEL